MISHFKVYKNSIGKLLKLHIEVKQKAVQNCIYFSFHTIEIGSLKDYLCSLRIWILTQSEERRYYLVS